MSNALDTGRAATSPWSIPARGWVAVAKRTWREATEDSVGLIAAGVAFYGLLAIAPLLGASILVYGLVADLSDIGSDLGAMLVFMPADAVRLVGELLVGAVHTSEGKKGFGILIALAIAVYGGMNGASALITALNIAYEEQERRGFVRVTLLALGITASAVLVLVLVLVAAAFVGYARRVFPGAPALLVLFGKAGLLSLTTVLGAAAAATLYRYGPDRREAKWIWLSPGSIMAAGLWLLISLGFGYYARTFGNYGAVYGSASAIIVMMTWLYLSAYVLLLGAELNSELERQTARDTTIGPEKDIGTRGAVVADSVAGEAPPAASAA